MMAFIGFFFLRTRLGWPKVADPMIKAVTQWVKTHHDAEGLAIYLWLGMMFYHSRLNSRSEMTLSLYDSG
jgi:hypothetical protein